MPQQTQQRKKEDRYEVTPGKVAAGTAAIGAGIYGGKVGGAYSARRAAKYLTDERLAAAAAKNFSRKAGGESAKIHRKVRPSASRWQTTFTGQRKIKTAGPVPTGHRDLWLRPGRSRAAYDKDILERGIRNSPRMDEKLYRGMTTQYDQTTGPLKHEHMSAWTKNRAAAEQYANSAQMYSNLPNWARKSRNVPQGARHPRVLEHEGGQAFNITPFARRYNNPMFKYLPDEARPNEYLMGPGVYKALGGPMPSLSELGEISKANLLGRVRAADPWKIKETRRLKGAKQEAENEFMRHFIGESHINPLPKEQLTPEAFEQAQRKSWSATNEWRNAQNARNKRIGITAGVAGGTAVTGAGVGGGVAWNRRRRRNANVG